MNTKNATPRSAGTTKQKNPLVKKALEGVVVSDKMEKTVVVLVDRYVKDLKYKKYYKTSKRYKAHDEKNEYKMGDRVQIIETIPMSKDKHFKVIALSK